MALLDGFFSDDNPSAVAVALAALETGGPGPFDRSFGAVVDTETHSRQQGDADRLRYARGGLFAPSIFGPDRDFMCNCGELVGRTHEGSVCAKCGVVVGPSSLRSQRFGHVEVRDLIHPVIFHEMLDGLAIMPSDLHRVATGKAVLRDGVVCMHDGGGTEDGDLVGPSGVAAWLRATDPDHPALAFCRLTRIPVPPADARPFVTGLAPTMVDPWIGPVNELWVGLVDRARRYLRLLELDAPPIILLNEQCMLQEAFLAIFDRMRPPRTLAPPLASVPEELEEGEALRIAWVSADALVVQQRGRVSVIGTNGASRIELPPAGCVLRGVIGERIAVFQGFFTHTHPGFGQSACFAGDVSRADGELSAIDCVEGRYLVDIPEGLPRGFVINDEPEDLFLERADGSRRKLTVGGDRPAVLAYTKDLRFAWVSGAGTSVIDLDSAIPHVTPVEPREDEEEEVVFQLTEPREDDDEDHDADAWGSAAAFCDGEWRFVWPTGIFADHRAKRCVRLRPTPRAAAFDRDGARLALIVADEVVIVTVPELRVMSRFALPPG